jgi:ubiquinone/menaquinone biosynthesis C-methylase UbiE
MLDRQVPFLSNRRLDAMLGARPGERILEIGPGTGLQALHVASQLAPGGRLDIVDVQQRMLDHVMRQAAARALTQIVPTLADASALPFPDATFDAAYVVTALGEVPDPPAAVRELGRVLRPGGRLVVGECFERHFVPLVTLLRYANPAGLALTAQLGPPVSYLAQFRARDPLSDGSRTQPRRDAMRVWSRTAR